MKLSNEFSLIRNWAEQKGIYDKGDIKTQYIKLQEEAGELAQSILKSDKAEFKDAIGDCVIVLTNLATLGGITIEDCINSAYEVISSRTGKMENGTFVKNTTLNQTLCKSSKEAKLHKNGYWNMPFKYTEINIFFEKYDLLIDGILYTGADALHRYIKPSLSKGGVAYLPVNWLTK